MTINFDLKFPETLKSFDIDTLIRYVKIGLKEEYDGILNGWHINLVLSAVQINCVTIKSKKISMRLVCSS